MVPGFVSGPEPADLSRSTQPVAAPVPGERPPAQPLAPAFPAPQRCGQPGQQHGLRMPLRILSMPTAMRRCRVASCFGEVTQQIHSFRASGVMSIHRLDAAASRPMASRKSAGNAWTVPSWSLLEGMAVFRCAVHMTSLDAAMSGTSPVAGSAHVAGAGQPTRRFCRWLVNNVQSAVVLVKPLTSAHGLAAMTRSRMG